MKRLLGIALSILVCGSALAASPEEELQAYIAVFKSNAVPKDATEELAWKGISDTRLYDLIEQRVNAEWAGAARGGKEERDRVSYYIRALGFSGQPKYAGTLSTVELDRTYARHAGIALQDVGLYAKWNPIIAERAGFDPKLSDDANRVMNMLRSNDLLLWRLGAKRVYFRQDEDPVVDLLAEKLKGNIASAQSEDKDTLDAIAWMIKAVGRVGKERHRGLLQDIRATAPNRKIANQAASSLKAFGGKQ